MPQTKPPRKRYWLWGGILAWMIHLPVIFVFSALSLSCAFNAKSGICRLVDPGSTLTSLILFLLFHPGSLLSLGWSFAIGATGGVWYAKASGRRKTHLLDHRDPPEKFDDRVEDPE